MNCACRMSIPDAACSIFRERALPASDWEKVLAWARFMQLMLNRQVRLHAAQHQQPVGVSSQEAALPAQTAPPADSPRKQKPIRCSSKTRENSLSVCFVMLLPSDKNPAGCIHRHVAGLLHVILALGIKGPVWCAQSRSVL